MFLLDIPVIGQLYGQFAGECAERGQHTKNCSCETESLFDMSDHSSPADMAEDDWLSGLS